MPPRQEEHNEADERAALIAEATRELVPISQWPLLLFYASEIGTFMFRTFDGGDLYMDYQRKSTFGAGLFQFVFNLIFMIYMVWRVVIVQSGGKSRLEHMRIAQRVAHINMVFLTSVLIGLLVFLDLFKVGYSGPHAEFLVQLGIDICGYTALFLAWLGPPGKGFGLPSDLPSKIGHIAFGVVIVTLSFFQLSARTNERNKMQTLDTLHMMTEAVVVVQILNLVLWAN